MPAKASERVWPRIEHYMRGKNWNTAQLARESGVPASTLSRWKDAGANFEPRIDALQEVARALGVTVDALVGETDPPAEPEGHAGTLSKPESDLVILYRRNERFRRIVNNIVAELRLSAGDKDQ